MSFEWLMFENHDYCLKTMNVLHLFYLMALRVKTTCKQARNQLGTPGGEEFSEKGPNFKLRAIVSHYVQHIFPGG